MDPMAKVVIGFLSFVAVSMVVMVYFGIQQGMKFDEECRAKGGKPVEFHHRTHCVRPDLFIPMK